MVTIVSIVKKIAKTIKKFIFSVSTWGLEESKIGFKKRYAIPILIRVTNKKTFPTLLIATDFTFNKMKTIIREQTEKNIYKNGSEY